MSLSVNSGCPWRSRTQSRGLRYGLFDSAPSRGYHDHMSNNPPPTPTSAHILGVRVDDVTLDEALSWAERAIQSGAPRQVATVNVEFVMAARGDGEFRRVLAGSALCVPDSAGIMWAARTLGRPLRERIPGVEMAQGLAALAAQRGYGLYLLGAAPGVAEQAAAKLREAHPALRIAGTYAGSPAAAEEAEIVARIRQAAPQILLVAYGAPKQELWISRNMHRLGVPVLMGVGGTLDYLAGVVKRAPAAWRRLGLEWLYRLYRQPWRWRRMLSLPHFAWRVLVARLGRAEEERC